MNKLESIRASMKLLLALLRDCGTMNAWQEDLFGSMLEDDYMLIREMNKRVKPAREAIETRQVSYIEDPDLKAWYQVAVAKGLDESAREILLSICRNLE